MADKITLAPEEIQREKLPDILRGFAIILVVLGHCIQEGSGEVFRAQALYFNDKLYQFIYSFHMPLFMMISGYLCWGSMQRAVTRNERRALLKRRVVTLLAPIFLWTAVDYARILITNYIKGEAQPEAIVFVYFYNALNNLWFLWAVLWCFLIVYVMHYFLKNSIVLYVLGFMGLFFIPDGLGLGAYKYMMPFFIVSFYGHGFMERHSSYFDKTPKLWLIAVMGVIFAGLFLFFDEGSLIYLTGYKIIGKDVLNQLGIDFYRMLIGFVGSGFFIVLWKYILANTHFEYRLLCALGIDSMGIYILSGYLLVFVVQKFVLTDQPSYLMNMIEAVVVLAVSLVLTRIFGKIPVLKKFVGK